MGFDCRCNLSTVFMGGFLYYLSNYEVEVTTYGTFENSRVNTSRGQFNEKVDTFNNNNYGVGESENKK